MSEPINFEDQLAMDGYRVAAAMSKRLLELRIYLRSYFDYHEGLSLAAHEQLHLLIAQIDLTLMALHEDQGKVIQ